MEFLKRIEVINLWKKHYSEFDEQEVTMASSTGTTIRWLINRENEDVNIAMRRFVLSPNGQIGLHSHPEYHEIYVLSGKARVFNDKDDEVEAGVGDVLYVPPEEEHGYETIGNKPFEFICIIPILEKK